MSGSVNKVIIVGNLGKDPEIRTFQNGGKVCNLTVATSESWRDKSSGERKERTEWHTVAIFSEPIIRYVEQYASKGTKVYVEGQLETRKWQDNAGNDRYSTEVVLRPYRSELTILTPRNGGERRDDDRQNNNYPTGAPNGGGGFRNDLDDEIPFAPEVR